MSVPFKGTVNIDIKDSTPDWSPYSQPAAPEGAPSHVALGVHRRNDPQGHCRRARRPVGRSRKGSPGRVRTRLTTQSVGREGPPAP